MKPKINWHSPWITAGLLAVGLMFMANGIWREEYRIVMSKAVNICLECIGIG